MAVDMTPKNYWIYQIAIVDDELVELESLVQEGKSEYVAGLLIGKLKSNGKLVVPKSEETKA